MKSNAKRTFNNISDRLKAEIPRLKPGETVLFQMLNGMPNPDPDEKERAKSPMLFGKRQVQTNFRIYDPYQQDSKGQEIGGYVDCGVVEQWLNDEPFRFRTFVPGQGEYAQFQGKFQLNAGNIKDEELYEALWLSNEREENPHRDKSVQPLFKIINTKTESKATVTNIDRLLKAIGLAKELGVEELSAVMASLNQATPQDIEVLRPQALKFAKDNVNEFLAAYDSPDKETNLTIRMAIEAAVLTHDIVTGDVKTGNVILTNIRVSTLNEFVPRFTEWVKASANGKDVLANLKNQVTGSKKEKVK